MMAEMDKADSDSYPAQRVVRFTPASSKKTTQQRIGITRR